MSTVYLHIGVPKTGTTTLQRFITANRDIIEQKGYVYPDFGIEYPNIGKARNGYFVAFTGKDRFPEEVKESYRRLAQVAKKWDKIIISDEAIWNRQKPPGFWKMVKEEFDKIGLSMHVIVYLRRQDSLVEAFWSQRVKSKGKMTMSFDEFMVDKYKFMPMDYAKWLDVIREEAQPKELSVRVFERGQLLGGSVIDDFCDVIGMPVTSEFRIPSDANVSLTPDVIEIKRIINRNASFLDIYDFYYDAIRAAFSKEERTGSRISMFSEEERRAFMEPLEEGNAYVAKKYFGRESGELFYESPKDIEKWEPEMEKMLTASVRVLSSADVLLYKRMDELERKLSLIYDSLPAKLYRRMRGMEDTEV